MQTKVVLHSHPLDDSVLKVLNNGVRGFCRSGCLLFKRFRRAIRPSAFTISWIEEIYFNPGWERQLSRSPQLTNDSWISVGISLLPRKTDYGGNETSLSVETITYLTFRTNNLEISSEIFFVLFSGCRSHRITLVRRCRRICNGFPRLVGQGCRWEIRSTDSSGFFRKVRLLQLWQQRATSKVKGKF